MLLGYPELSHFMKNYNSPCWQLFLLFLSLSSSVSWWWPLIKYSGVLPQPVCPWELLSPYRCRKTREIVKSRTWNSLRNCQLLSVLVSNALVPGVHWCLMPGGEAAATRGEFRASLTSLSIPLLSWAGPPLTLMSPHSQEATHASACVRARSGFLKWWFLFQYDSFRDQNSVVPFGLGSKLLEDCKPMSSYYKVNFPNYIDKK